MAVAEISVREQTYRRVVELEHAGMNRKQAFDYIEHNDDLGISRNGIEQRYYGHAAKVRDGDGLPPSTRGRRPRPDAAAASPDKSTADGLDIVVTLLRGLIDEVKQLEADAQRWREVRELLDR